MGHLRRPGASAMNSFAGWAGAMFYNRSGLRPGPRMVAVNDDASPSSAFSSSVCESTWCGVSWRRLDMRQSASVKDGCRHGQRKIQNCCSKRPVRSDARGSRGDVRGYFDVGHIGGDGHVVFDWAVEQTLFDDAYAFDQDLGHADVGVLQRGHRRVGHLGRSRRWRRDVPQRLGLRPGHQWLGGPERRRCTRWFNRPRRWPLTRTSAGAWTWNRRGRVLRHAVRVDVRAASTKAAVRPRRGHPTVAPTAQPRHTIVADTVDVRRRPEHLQRTRRPASRSSCSRSPRDHLTASTPFLAPPRSWRRRPRTTAWAEQRRPADHHHRGVVVVVIGGGAAAFLVMKKGTRRLAQRRSWATS